MARTPRCDSGGRRGSRPEVWRALALALLAAAAAAAQTAEEKFEGLEQVVEVEVPVNVLTRDGEPVRDLTVEDFEILDNGAPQEITGFRLIDLDLVQPGPTRTEIEEAIPATGRRHVLFLFDLSFSTPQAVLRAREAAREYALRGLHPTDLVAVATHAIESGARLVVTFTPDRAQVARAIDTLGAPRLLQLAQRDPLRFIIDDPERVARDASQGLGGGDDATIQRNRESVSQHIAIIANEMAKVEKSFLRGRVSSWSHSMAELGRYLDSVRGRKHIVYFSEGFDGRLVFGRQPSADDPDTVRDMENLASGQSWLVDTDNIYGNTLAQTDLSLMIEEFRRADCVIQAVDIGGLRADTAAEERARSVGQDALFYIANETGGNLFQDANDFGSQLERAMERSTVTYLLSFRPSEVAYDGAYHHLKVKVEAPSPVRVSAREGYYAPRPYEQLHPMEKTLIASDAIAAATPDESVPLHVLAAAFKAGPGAAYVPVIIEARGEELLEGHEAEQLAIEFYVYATDERGEMKDFFTQLVTLDLAAARQAFAEAGVKYYGHLDLAPGDHLLRVLVRNSTTGRSGVATVNLEVPAYDAADPVLLPPFFVESESRWLLVREKAPEYERTVAYPFTVNGEPYIPAASPRLENGDKAQVCVVAYNLAADAAVDGRIVAADGTVVETAGLGPVERTVTGIDGLEKFVATFSPSQLPRGEYTFEVALTDPRGGMTQTNSMPFSVN